MIPLEPGSHKLAKKTAYLFDTDFRIIILYNKRYVGMSLFFKKRKNLMTEKVIFARMIVDNISYTQVGLNC